MVLKKRPATVRPASWASAEWPVLDTAQDTGTVTIPQRANVVPRLSIAFKYIYKKTVTLQAWIRHDQSASLKLCIWYLKKL